MSQPAASSAPQSALYGFLSLAGVMSCFYVLRPVRDALGTQYPLQWLFLGTFLSVLALLPLHAYALSRWPRQRFVPLILGAFAVLMVLFHALLAQKAAPAWVGIAFFIFVAVFVVYGVSLLWALLADVYSPTAARQDYGYIAAGATSGALLGPPLSLLLVPLLGVPAMLLVAAGLLTLGIFAALKVARSSGGEATAAVGGGLWEGARLVRSQPVLWGLLLLVFFNSGAGTLLYNVQVDVARQLYPDLAQRATYFARIDLAINVGALLLQFLVARWLLTRYGSGPAMLIPTLLMAMSFVVLAASPLPAMVALAQIAQRGSAFGLLQPGRESLYPGQSRMARYKAKTFIDVIVFRGADVVFVWAHQALVLLGAGIPGIAMAGLLLTLGMGFGAWRAARAAQSPATAKVELPAP